MSASETLDMYTEKSLTSVSHAVNAGGPLACYVAVAMTVTGSEYVTFPSRPTVETFCRNGSS